METQKTLIAEPKDKDVGKPSPRGETDRRFNAFKEAIGSLRGQPRPEILPFRCDSPINAEENITEQEGESWISTLDSRYGQRWSSETYVATSQADRIHNPEGISPTVPTATGGRHTPMIAIPVLTPDRISARIRRLTPIECERLQGFPDDWTAGFSDTQRYKMMGNAVTVNVIEAIAKRL